jgi:hypothetical protein
MVQHGIPRGKQMQANPGYKKNAGIDDAGVM